MPELTEKCAYVRRDRDPKAMLVMPAGLAVHEMAGSTP
jgi:hypothetical protein